MERDEGIYMLFMELLKKYKEAEYICINEYSGNISKDLGELNDEVKQYENKINELLGR
ncbi:hypothetical protein ACQKLN_29825 [Paenibacillus glucanolyticus]|uniref:hypothetical protein n=1 Tax=Paenibacillus glucanolyticus TaxID=59843 RepID=UPI0036B7889F